MFFTQPALATDSDPETTEEVIEQIRSMQDDVLACVENEIQRLSIEENGDPDWEKFEEIDGLSRDTKFIIFDETSTNYLFIREHGAEKFCKEQLFPNIKKGFLEAYPVWKENASGVLARVGLRDISKFVPFLGALNNARGNHVYGHSDITAKALEEINKTHPKAGDGAIYFSEGAIAIAMSASQAVDFYRWDDEAFHAHSTEYDSDDLDARKAAIANGKDNFYNTFMEYWALAIDEPSPRKTAAYLGILGHMVQDLVYHQGMSLIQHAGLSNYLGEDPDIPEGSGNYPVEPLTGPAAEQFNLAVQVTTHIYKEIIQRKKKSTLERLASFTIDDTFNFKNFFDNVFRGGVDEPAVLVSMGTYVASGWVYFFGIRPKDELTPGGDNGLIQWNVSDVMKELEERW